MKRFCSWLLLLMLAASLLPFQAVAYDTYYVYTPNGKTLNLRDEYTNKVIGNIPFGTALTPDENKSTEISAYVTYKGVSGFAKWEFLQKDKPKSKPKATPAPAQSGQRNNGGNVPYQGQQNLDGFEITALGAYIQFANSKNKGAGDKWETLTVSSSDNIVITADVPRGRKIDYWVINGVRYDFSETVKTIRLTDIDADFEFEAVYTKSSSQTLISPSEIQDARTGETLLIETVNAQLAHLKNKTAAGGGWITSFDFTDDYENRATGRWEDGGQVSARVKATVKKGRKVRGWKFNETKLYPNSTVNYFIVRTLNASMTYEPIFNSTKATAKPKTEKPTTGNKVTPSPTLRITNELLLTIVTPTPTPRRRVTRRPVQRVTPKRRTGITVTPSPTPRLSVVRPARTRSRVVVLVTPTPRPRRVIRVTRP